MKSTTLIKVFAAPVFALLTFSAQAQANTFDISAGGGLASYHNNGSANKGLFEASAVYNAASHFGVGFEYTVSTLDSVNQTLGTATIKGTDRLHHYGGVVRFPFAVSSHAEPFVAAHFGGLHEVASATATSGTSTQSASQSANGGYFGASLGANLMFSHNFGVRPEVRYDYDRENGGHLHELDVLGSLFYRFGGTTRTSHRH